MTWLLRCKLFLEIAWRHTQAGQRMPAKVAWEVARVIYPRRIP